LKIDFEIVGKALKITKISNFLISGRIMKAVSQMLSKAIILALALIVFKG
jgi:hypothetical protein